MINNISTINKNTNSAITRNIISGYLPEQNTTNYLSASDFSSSWTLSAVKALRSGTYYGLPTYSIVGDAAGTQRRMVVLTSTLPEPANGIVKTFSVYAKKADPNVPFLYLSATPSPVVAAWFNLHSGTITCVSGAVSFGITASIQPMGAGWYRCAVSYPQADVVRAWCGIATGSGVDQDANTNLTGAIITGLQFETGSYVPSSYISYMVLSSSGRSIANCAPTREKDSLFYSGSFFLSASLQATTLLNSNVSASAAGIVELNDGTTNNRISIGVSQFVPFQFANVLSGNVAQLARFFKMNSVNSDPIYNGDRHTIKLNYSSASFTVLADGVETPEGTALTGNMPPSLTTLAIGVTSEGSYLANGLVTSVEIEKNTIGLTMFPMRTSGDTNTDLFSVNSDINARNLYAKSLLQSADRDNKNDLGNLFVKVDADSSKDQEHYFGGNKKHFDLKLIGLSGNLLAGTNMTLVGAVGIELSSTLMDLNNVVIIPGSTPFLASSSFDVQSVFGHASSSGHSLANSKLKFSVSASNTPFSASDIAVEFRDLTSSDWSTYKRVEKIGVFISSSANPGWVDYEYNFSLNGKIAHPKMSYINVSPFIRLSSSTGKTYVFRDVRVEFQEALLDAGVVFYKNIDNDNNDDNFSYLNERVIKDVES